MCTELAQGSLCSATMTVASQTVAPPCGWSRSHLFNQNCSSVHWGSVHLCFHQNLLNVIIFIYIILTFRYIILRLQGGRIVHPGQCDLLLSNYYDDHYHLRIMHKGGLAGQDTRRGWSGSRSTARWRMLLDRTSATKLWNYPWRG